MTSKPRFPPRLEFCSYLAYPPRHVVEGQSARALVFTIKRDGASLKPGVSLIQQFVQRLKREAPRALFDWAFDGSWTAVPVPASRPTPPNAVWAARSICDVLYSEGLVADTQEIVQRQTALPKSSLAAPGKRPNPIDHYQTMMAAPPFVRPSKILLVDDVVSRGATAGGAAARVWDVVPDAEVRLFAMARTMSTFDALVVPTTGYIQTLPTYARRHDAS